VHMFAVPGGERDARTSGLLHIITDGTQYTEHTVDVHSNRT